PLFLDPATKSKLFRENIVNDLVSLDSKVTDKFLAKELIKIGACSGRDLRSLIIYIYKIYKNQEEKSNKAIIKKKHIKTAIKGYIERKEETKYDDKDETANEIQERHHKKNIKIQKRHHKENLESQEKH